MTKMLSLEDFEPPIFDETASVGLVDDIPQYCSIDLLNDELQPFFKYVRDIPEIRITHDMLATRESARTIGAGDLFLPIHDSAYKKIASAWREKGLSEAIRLAAAENPENITHSLHWIATKLKWALDLMERGIYQKEILPLSGAGSVTDVVAVRDWNFSLIRCMSWHPHCTRIAVATRDDRIHIFSEGITGRPVLRHSAQKAVCCMSWRPFAGRELAIGCQSGVLVWTIELGAASNSLSHALLLKQRNHAPVTSVAWHPDGNLLVSCSPSDANMLIWDVSNEEGIPLRRVMGGGLCFAKWSHCGSRLFAATSRQVFRVWNTGTPTSWTYERWRIPTTRIGAACFGPNLSLLFTSTEDPATIFTLPLQEFIFNENQSKSIEDVKTAVPIIDFTRYTFTSDVDDDYIIAGGRVVAMEWDPSGKYLAVLFQDSPVIALIKTKTGTLSRIVNVEPCCLIKGFPGEVPNCMQFYQRGDTMPLCLTIAWSSGRVQHFPIVNNVDNKISANMNPSLLISSFADRSDLYTTVQNFTFCS